MPKLKTRKSAFKRYKQTGAGNFLRRHAYKGHLLRKKSKAQKRKLSQNLCVSSTDTGYTESNIRNTALTADGSQQGESPLNEGKLMTAQEVALHMIKAIKKRKKVLILTPMGKITVLMNKLFNSWMDQKTYAFVKKEPNSPFK